MTLNWERERFNNLISDRAGVEPPPEPEEAG